jgi:hypothetical protein
MSDARVLGHRGELLMDWTIRPNVGVGPIRFGMTRQEVRETIGTLPSVFAKASGSTSLTDDFREHGIHIYYDDSDHCVAVEMGMPASPSLQGRPLLGEPFSVVRDWLLAIDPAIETDGDGLTSKVLGSGVYAPAVDKDESTPIEAVIAFAPGHG